MEPTHSLLKRQLKRHFGDDTRVAAEWRAFVDAVGEAYREFDVDREMLERSLELSSQELLAANSQMRAIFQAIPDLLFRLDRDGTILDLKAGATRDLVLQRQQLFGKRIQDIPIKSISDQFCSALENVRQGGTAVRIEYALTVQGQEYFYEARLVPLPENQIVAIVQNVTERTQAESNRVRQARHATLRADVNQAFTAGGATLQKTLQACSEAVVRHLDAAFARIWTLNAQDNVLELQASAGLYTHLDGPHARVPVGAFKIGLIAQERKPHFTNDVVHDPRVSHPDWAQREGMIAFAGHPLIVENRLVGVLGLFARHKLTEDAVEALGSIAFAVAQGIERKRTEERLRQTVSLLQSTLNSTADGILVVDASGRIVLFNERFTSMWRIPEKIMAAGDDNAALTYALNQVKDPDAFLRKVKELYATPDAESIDELEFKDGRVFERYSCPQRLDGAPVGRVWSFRDITNRKRTEEELRSKTALLEAQFNSSIDGILVVDNEGRKIFQNQRTIDLWKIPEHIVANSDDEQQIRFVMDSTKNPDQFAAKVQHLYAHPHEVSQDEIELKDGTVLERYSAPVTGKDGKLYGRIWNFRDVTERKELEAQLRQAQKMEAFGQLAAGVAHDFNNILTVIQGNLSLLRTGAMNAKDQTSALGQTTRAAERAANLTRQLLTFSRRQPLQPKDLDLNEVVVNMTRMLHRLIGEHIALEAHYAPGGAPIHADPGMMEQVLMNLAVNSRDAMPKGGRLILRTATTTLNEADVRHRPSARAGDFVELSVSDTGSGIAPQNLPHIFEPFFTTKEIGKGTGLGLATVFGIIDQHEGWIEVESDADRGTTFRMFLPRLARQAAPSTSFSPLREVRGGNETILLVEDEVDVRELMQTLLSGQGYQVHEAASGRAAFDVWRQHRDQIQMLLTDMVMPEGVGGRELAQRLTAEKPGLKVMYCSGYTDEALGQDTPLRNNVNFLEKPFDPLKFLQRVRHCLDEG
jgi:PAS domain S-box-containing protein